MKARNIDELASYTRELKAQGQAETRRRLRSSPAGALQRASETAAIGKMLSIAIAAAPAIGGRGRVAQLNALETELYQLLATSPAAWQQLRKSFITLFRRARRDLRALERATMGECS